MGREPSRVTGKFIRCIRVARILKITFGGIISCDYNVELLNAKFACCRVNCVKHRLCSALNDCRNGSDYKLYTKQHDRRILIADRPNYRHNDSRMLTRFSRVSSSRWKQRTLLLLLLLLLLLIRRRQTGGQTWLDERRQLKQVSSIGPKYIGFGLINNSVAIVNNTTQLKSPAKLLALEKVKK